MKEKKFDWGYFLRHIAIIAVPVALQNLLTTTGSMVDTIMLAKLGEKAVGAVGLCAQFSSLMFAGYWGFVGGGMLFFSQYWGAKDDDGITRSYGLTLLFMLSVGLLFACLALFLLSSSFFFDSTEALDVLMSFFSFSSSFFVSSIFFCCASIDAIISLSASASSEII